MQVGRLLDFFQVFFVVGSDFIGFSWLKAKKG
jgi:hypothetical protein